MELEERGSDFARLLSSFGNPVKTILGPRKQGELSGPKGDHGRK